MVLKQSDIPVRTQEMAAAEVVDKQERLEALIGHLAPTRGTELIASPDADAASLKVAVDEIIAVLEDVGILGTAE